MNPKHLLGLLIFLELYVRGFFDYPIASAPILPKLYFSWVILNFIIFVKTKDIHNGRCSS